LAAMGQAGLTVTPLQAALATATLATGGQRPVPRLVEAVTDASGQWVSQPSALVGETAVSASTAVAVRETWPLSGDGGELAASSREFAVSTLSGPDGHYNSWYLGFAPADAPRFVVALVLEDEDAITTAEAVGRAVLAAAAR
ncbi:MAG TPA: penicillin-binding transpeptidase domain-containing protein, partial [Promineifilum sp.]|nr:penicillin-binding transpeptidase domain-containing protein [Promineifilum sp.]